MAINVEIRRNGNENNMSVIRRFTRRVQESGVLSRVRGLRYAERTPSTYTKKKMRLKSLTRKAEVEQLIKLGKMQEVRPHSR